MLLLLLLALVEAERSYTVGLFLRSPREKALATQARHVSDPKDSSYGQYLDQAALRSAVAVPVSEAAAAVGALRRAVRAAKKEEKVKPRVVAHGDAVTVELEDFFVAYDLREALSEEWPPSAELLVTPPMADDFCEELGDRCRRPCARHNETCKGSFAGWICWRDRNVSTLRPGAEWHCFEPKDFKAVNSSVKSSHRKRRRGVQAMEVLEKKQQRFHALPRSGGFSLLTRNTTFEQGWQSLEISFVQEGLVQNRLIVREDFERHGDFHRAAVTALKNLRHVKEIFVCFNMDVVRSLAPLGQAGCDCNASEGGFDRRLRGCEKVWSLTLEDVESTKVLPRQVQSLEALYRDLEVPQEALAAGSQAVAQFNEESFLQEDVVHLHRAYGIESLSELQSIEVYGALGKVDDSEQAGEGSLDLQTITSLAPHAKTTWWGIGPKNLDGFILAYAVQVNDHPKPPLVHSVSWGDAEALYPQAFVERLDYELMKLALRGITVIVASGDNGNSAVGSDCDWVPDLVGSSEWITSVGATMPSLKSKPYCFSDPFEHLGSCEELGQVVCSTEQGALITSSGYFSVYRRRPWYQERAVGGFLKQNCSPCALHPELLREEEESQEVKELLVPCQHVSTKGCSLSSLLKHSRAAPDLALPGQSYPVLVNRSVFSFDGTSASAPALAALISRLNGEQLRRGRPPLGLLNPWLYQAHAEHPEAFLDVTVGDTASTEAELCGHGFAAAPGWDAATGLGVPRFARLRRLLPKAESGESSSLAERRGGSTWPLLSASASALALSGVLLFAVRGRRTLAAQLTRPLLH